MRSIVRELRVDILRRQWSKRQGRRIGVTTIEGSTGTGSQHGITHILQGSSTQFCAMNLLRGILLPELAFAAEHRRKFFQEVPIGGDVRRL